MAGERWSVTRATANFDELLDQVITTRKPIFIDGERRSAVLISIEEWNAIQDKVMPSVPSPLKNRLLGLLRF
jgi:PHD/YefM family antitoxin component YafN of YafNO toxin-antitoxin module